MHVLQVKTYTNKWRGNGVIFFCGIVGKGDSFHNFGVSERLNICIYKQVI